MSQLASISKAAVSGVVSSASAPVNAAFTLGRVALDVAQSLTKNKLSTGPLDSLGDYNELIQMQLAVQKEMQTVTMVSNVEKSRHESKMSAVRNVRVA